MKRALPRPRPFPLEIWSRSSVTKAALSTGSTESRAKAGGSSITPCRLKISGFLTANETLTSLAHAPMLGLLRRNAKRLSFLWLLRIPDHGLRRFSAAIVPHACRPPSKHQPADVSFDLLLR